MKDLEKLFESIQKQIDDFMGDQHHGYVLTVHQCGENECAMDLTTNLEPEGVVSMTVELLQEVSKEVDGIDIKAIPIMGSVDGKKKPQIH